MVRHDEASERNDQAQEARRETREQTTSSVSTLAVVTAAHGRHEELQAMHEHLARGSLRPRLLVAVALDDEAMVDWAPDEGAPVAVLPLSLTPLGAPWAAAKNAGATMAFDAGAEVVAFVRAGTVVADGTLAALDAAARAGDGVWWARGPEASGEAGSRAEHPDDLDGHHDPHDIDTTAFALSLSTWATLRGYDDDLVGTGWEDLDLALRAEREGLGLGPAPGAVLAGRPAVRADGERPPGDHHDARERNAALYEQRWGRRPPEDVVGGW